MDHNGEDELESLSEFREKDHTMSTKMLNKPLVALIGGLAAGLIGQGAAATEEMVVYGAATAAQARAHEAHLQLTVKEYAQSLNNDVKAKLTKELKELPAPKLELAMSEVSTRG
jgi:hypothetical protein